MNINSDNEIVYKYYSNESDYALINFKENKISFSPVEELNDPWEGVGYYSIPQTAESTEFWNSIGRPNGYIDIEHDIIEQTRDAINFKYRVFSVAKVFDNPLLWAHYANSHKGFCVGYRKSDIPSDHFVDIKYSDKIYPIENSDELYKQLLFKPKEWSYENESRAIYEVKYSDIDHFHSTAEYYANSDMKNDKIWSPIDFHCTDKFIIKECPAVSIYFGLNIDLKYAKKLYEIAQQKKIEIYIMKKKHNTFKLEYTRIS